MSRRGGFYLAYDAPQTAHCGVDSFPGVYNIARKKNGTHHAFLIWNELIHVRSFTPRLPFERLLTSTHNFLCLLGADITTRTPRVLHNLVKFGPTFWESSMTADFDVFVNCSGIPYKFVSAHFQSHSSQGHKNSSSLSIWPPYVQSSALSYACKTFRGYCFGCVWRCPI